MFNTPSLINKSAEDHKETEEAVQKEISSKGKKSNGTKSSWFDISTSWDSCSAKKKKPSVRKVLTTK